MSSKQIDFSGVFKSSSEAKSNLLELSAKNFATLLSDHTCIKVSGPDAASFLQGQISCDVNKITETHFSLGLHCNVQGRIIASFYCFKEKNNYYLSMPKDIVTPFLEHIKKFAVFSKVEFTSCDESFISIGIKSENALPEILFNEYNTVTLDGFVVLRLRHDRFMFNGSAEKIHHYFTSHKDYFNDFEIVDTKAWHLMDILDGVPRIHENTVEEYLPHRLNFQNLGALDWEKGCYIGQEIIARIHYRGKIKHKLYSVKIRSEQALSPGDKLLSDKRAAADLVDAVKIDKNIFYCLIVTTDQFRGQSDFELDGKISVNIVW